MTTLRTDSTHSGINIEYANGSGFVHGGSGPLTVYSDDEKAAIKALQNVDNETYYLFVVDNATRLNPDGTAMKDILAGYMPIGYQCGFLFGSPAAKYVAHELGHGAFGLHHTFSSETESFSAPQYSTDNLMDYAEGATLNHKQWRWMHEKHGSGLFGFLVNESEGEAVIENVVVAWEKDYTTNPQNLYNKANLRFVKIGRMKYDDPTHSLFYKMKDGAIIREYDMVSQYYSTDETERKFEIILPDTKEPIPFYLDKYKDIRLSDDLAFIGKEVSRIAGTTIGRYVLPIEDFYILIEGKDFDGEEASRVAAGGFILLEAVQVDKVYKLVKGAKILTKGGLKPTSKIVMHLGKEITKESVINMSCQLVVNLMKDCIEHPEYTDEELFLSAFSQIDVGNTILGSTISTITFEPKEQAAYVCAQKFFEAFEKEKRVDMEAINKGFFDCVIEAGLTMLFKYGAETDYMKGLFKQFNGEVKRNVLSRFKGLTGENCYKLFEQLLKQTLQQ